MHARGENNEENLLDNVGHPDLRKPRAKDDPAASSDIQLEPRSSAAPDEEGDEGKDSGNESAETDSDNEEKREENIRKLQNSLVGMNVSSFLSLYENHGRGHLAGNYQQDEF